MKKIFLSLAVCFGMVAANAQDETTATAEADDTGAAASTELSFTSKNGHEVLPKSGEYALGVGATGLTTYMGNMFGFTGSNNTSPFSYASKGFPATVIYGKYFVADDMAYRASININAVTVSSTNIVDSDASDNPDDILIDMYTRQSSYFVFGGGLEKRRGSSRVQGVYGAEGYIYYGTGTTHTYDYANVIVEQNQQPESTEFTNPTSLPTPAEGYRILQAKTGSALGFGVRAFAGVEYFIAPKLSLGGEFNWGLSLMNQGEQEVTYEGFEAETNSAVTYTLSSKRGGSFNVNTSNLGGTVNLLFYF